MKFYNISYPKYIKQLTEKLSSIEINSLPDKIVIEGIDADTKEPNSSVHSKKYSDMFFIIIKDSSIKVKFVNYNRFGTDFNIDLGEFIDNILKDFAIDIEKVNALKIQLARLNVKTFNELSITGIEELLTRYINPDLYYDSEGFIKNLSSKLNELNIKTYDHFLKVSDELLSNGFDEESILFLNSLTEWLKKFENDYKIIQKSKNTYDIIAQQKIENKKRLKSEVSEKRNKRNFNQFQNILPGEVNSSDITSYLPQNTNYSTSNPINNGWKDLELKKKRISEKISPQFTNSNYTLKALANKIVKAFNENQQLFCKDGVVDFKFSGYENFYSKFLLDEICKLDPRLRDITTIENIGSEVKISIQNVTATYFNSDHTNELCP